MNFGIITLLGTFIIMSWATYLAKKKGTHIHVLENGDRMLKNHIMFAILGYFIGAIFLFFIGLGFYFGWEIKDDETWASYIFPVLVLLALLYGFIYIMFYYYNHRVIYNSESITSYNAWGKAKSIKWMDLTDATYNRNMQQIWLYSEDGARIEMSHWLYGLKDFELEFAYHYPDMVKRIQNRSLF